MFEQKYRLRYVGEDASDGWLPAHEGAQSLEGMTWSIALIANYAATGSIKKRGSLDRRIRLYINPSRRGSFVTDIVAVVTQPNDLFLTASLGLGAAAAVGNAFGVLITQTLRGVCGLSGGAQQPGADRLQRLPSGDLEALIDGVEPSIVRAHSVVGAGAQTLTLSRGRSHLIEMDIATKQYVQTSVISNEVIEREVRVGALNINTGNGRVFLPDVGKTVPFSVIKEPDRGTYEVLSRSLNQRARGLPNDITIECQEVFGLDDSIKKLVIHAARETS